MVVLCIDNDPEDVEFFGDAIERVDSSIRCLSASSGQDALKLLSSIPNNHDLPKYLFLDVNMPQMSGKDTLREIRSNSRYNSVQIVMLSTGLNPNFAKEYFELGANHFMAKAYSLQDFSDKLKHILTF